MTHRAPHSTNPFSTRCVRPGAVKFMLRDGTDDDELLARLAEHDDWGEIVGAHGSGKSTLLARLAGALERKGVSVARIVLHDGQRRLPHGVLASRGAESPRIALVDGYEQLGRWQRWALKRRCRRLGWGLLVTTHESVGLPTLYRTTTDLDLALALARLLQGGTLSPVTAGDVAQAFTAHAGDLREVFFDLYDRYERYRTGELD